MRAWARLLCVAALAVAACSGDDPAGARTPPGDEPASSREATRAREVPDPGADPGTTPTEVQPPNRRVQVVAPASTERPELGVGQWARYAVTWAGGGRSVMDYRLVGAEAGAYWLEIEETRQGSRVVRKMLVDFGDRSSVEAVDIRAVMVRQGRETETIPERVLRDTQPLFRSFLAPLVGPFASEEREDVDAPAGSFVSCFVGQRSLELAGQTAELRLWFHPRVPVTGFVRMTSSLNGQRLELMSFGDDGARSAL